MKKFFSSLIAAAIFFIFSSSAMAAFEETLIEDADLASIKTLAVARPMHFKIEATEPRPDEFADILYNASRLAKHYMVIPYDDIVEYIWNGSSIDIKALNDTESRKIFNEHVGQYCDAYVVATSANNNKLVQFFFEVRDAKSGDLLYMLSIQERGFSKDLSGYTRACEEFYKRFDVVIEKSIKDAAKKNKKKKKD